MPKINDSTRYPPITPALTDRLPIVDVSDNAIYPNGTVKTVTGTALQTLLVTTASVTAAGALMDSEIDEAAVKALSARNFADRATLVSTWTALSAPVQAAIPNGTIWTAGGLKYERDSTATAISDLQGWKPVAPYSFAHFGCPTDGTDGATEWEAMMDFMEGIGGGTIEAEEGKTYHFTSITHASNTTVRLNGATIAVHSSQDENTDWYTSRDVSADGTRANIRPHIIGPGTFDGSAWTYSRWLSQADGTPVTDPEADYVMGTGALASGIASVSLTAVLTSDVVTSVTINNGGSGWNGHATYPYVPSTVQLMFTGGGGAGAAGYATISGGTLTSVTIEDGGAGYTSPPTVTTMGGYADIDLLVDVSVDRRNPDITHGDAVGFTKCYMPVVENVDFTGFRCRVLLDGGCYKGTYRGLKFDDTCGKRDGPFPAIYLLAYSTIGNAAYAPTEDVLVENCSFEGTERSAILFSPAAGGTIRNITADGCGESTIFLGERLCESGGKAVIEGSTLKNGVLTDIAANLIEAGNASDMIVKGCHLEGSSLSAIIATGNTDVRYENNTFKNNVTGLTTTADQRIPYGPFSERYSYSAGSMPIAGKAIHIPSRPIIAIGSVETEGTDGQDWNGNIFKEDRAEYPLYVFEQSKTSTSNISKDCSIIGNDMTGVPSGMGLLDDSAGNVWETTMPLHIRDNRGHVSEGPVVVSHQFNATGAVLLEPGFRPRQVFVYADVNNGARIRSWVGHFSWTRDGVRDDFGHAFATDGANFIGAIKDQDVIRIYSPAGADQLVVEFVGWSEKGFTVNCVTYNELTNARFVCVP